MASSFFENFNNLYIFCKIKSGTFSSIALNIGNYWNTLEGYDKSENLSLTQFVKYWRGGKYGKYSTIPF